MIRVTDGRLFPAEPELCAIDPQVGDTVIFTDEWEVGSAADWEPVTEVGIVESVVDEKAIIRRNGDRVERRIPAGMEVEQGDVAVYDGGLELIRVSTSTSDQHGLLLDDFDVSSVRQDPNPTLEWSDFAGFPDILQEAKDIVQVHTSNDAREKLRALGVDPVRGILFEGPPGTGKTFLAQIMAAKSGAAFYLVTTASLGGRLVSESEQRLAAIYGEAAKQDLSIIFIDEIEVLTKDRGAEHDAGSRLVNVFLTNMDGVAAPDNVITIGTTNRVKDIDRALRRPGRFDREVTFRNPDFDDRVAILGARPHKTEGPISYAQIANETEGWTAAELGAIWQHAGELTVIEGRSAILDDFFQMGFERAKQGRTNREAVSQ
jgi:transitional endoplasmic reticulum ATPase